MLDGEVETLGDDGRLALVEGAGDADGLLGADGVEGSVEMEVHVVGGIGPVMSGRGKGSAGRRVRSGWRVMRRVNGRRGE